VVDLEAAGIKIVQIDEAAFREGAFRLTACGVRNDTQIHTHMCYSEFNDVIESIAAMDADVITIETSRSPRVPPASEMAALMEKAMQRIPAQRLWVNPDCGLKTRAWPETEAA